MIEYHKKHTWIRSSTVDGMLPGWKKMFLCLNLKNRHKKVILDLKNVFIISHSPFNLVSLGLLNNDRIFYDNENEILYDRITKKTLAYAERWKTNYLFYPLNLSVSTTHLIQIDDDTYEWLAHIYRTTISPKLPLTTWHKWLDHLNFPLLKHYLDKLEIHYLDDSEKHICDSC